jgi:UDP-N-acetylglucosamine--dolichyl-phosphate N-acetylglucosaminephosphotransferase
MAFEHITISVAFSVIGFVTTYYTIPLVSELFIKRGLSGKDLLKPKAPIMYRIIFSFLQFIFCRPESMGVIVGVVYFVLMFLYIPIPLMNFTWKWNLSEVSVNFIHPFPHDQVDLILHI